MKKLLTASLAIFAVTMVAVAASPDGAGLILVRKNASAPIPGPTERFTGKAVIHSRFEAPDPSRIAVSIVSFSPGARTAWHTHPAGQTLAVISGCGWVQLEGGERQQIRPGDVIWTPPGVKHWHGAGTGGPMSHAAIQERVEHEVTWAQKVTDQEYGAGACKQDS
jgi:quercetin dioxygenase-like cupin family protein